MRRQTYVTLPTSTLRIGPPAGPASIVWSQPSKGKRVPARTYGFLNQPPKPPAPPEINPYVGYSRSFTAEGGILISSHPLGSNWRPFMWPVLSVLESWFVIDRNVFGNMEWNVALIVFLFVFNWYMAVRATRHQTVEIRPDCMIVDGKDVFWRKFMEGGWPDFEEDWKGRHVLCGIYGTRFVKYLGVRRSGRRDRMPEVFAIHLQNAMAQQWRRMV